MDLIDKFQWGFDVATSLAIVGSSAAFLFDQARKRKQAERRKFHESARSVVLDNMIAMSEHLSGIYMSEVVRSSQGLMTLTKSSVESVANRFANNPALAVRQIEILDKLSKASNRFIDEVHAARYQILPLLDHVDGGDMIRNEILASSPRLLNGGNSIHGFNRSLLEELIEFRNFAESVELKDDPEGYYKKAMSIMVDPDYREWVDRFLPDGEEDAYWAAVEASDGNVVHKYVAGFATVFKEKSNVYLAQMVFHSARNVQEHWTECKRFLVMLSSIIRVIMTDTGSMNDDDQKAILQKVFTEYQSDQYFDLKTTIR